MRDGKVHALVLNCSPVMCNSQAAAAAGAINYADEFDSASCTPPPLPPTQRCMCIVRAFQSINEQRIGTIRLMMMMLHFGCVVCARADFLRLLVEIANYGRWNQVISACFHFNKKYKTRGNPFKRQNNFSITDFSNNRELFDLEKIF